MKDRLIVPTGKSRLMVLSTWAMWLIGFYALALAAGHYSSQVGHLPACQQLPWMRFYLVIAVSLLAMLCFLYARSGWRSWRSGQYPAPGAPVLFTTRIWTGGWARVSAIADLMMGILALSMLAALLQYFVFSEVGLYMLGFRSCEA